MESLEKVLTKGTEAIAEAAIQAGCKYFFGYPITPQNEIPEYMSRRLPEIPGGMYVQAESEVAAVNMLLGAGATGKRVMTSSSSPGISLMSEGISYMVGQGTPVVVVNVMRAGPGLGGILPAQGDYNQATGGIGHGDCNLVALAPASLQETVDLVQSAFDISQRYRTPVIVIVDGVIGQIMEAVSIERVAHPASSNPETWAAGYMKERGGKRIVMQSLYLDPEMLEKHNQALEAKWKKIEAKELRYECYRTQDADLAITAFGTVARIAKSVVDDLRDEGYKVGIVRPITVHPFPYEIYGPVCETAKGMLCVEMNWGQMLKDVRLAVGGKIPVEFCGRSGGACPGMEEIASACRNMIDELGIEKG